jgi:hydantoinase/carbamoylase family amidase
MKDRRDAMTAAAEVILAVEGAAKMRKSTLVATVGTLTASPGSISVVPGSVALGIDIRDIERSGQNAGKAAILDSIAQIAARRRLAMSVHQIRDDPPVVMSDQIQNVIAETSDAYGIPWRRVPSHAGHDAASLSHITETGMIFVRNRSGRSHTEEEAIDLDDIADGVRVLTGTLIRLAGESLP